MGHQIDVPKSVTNYVLEQSACLFADYIPNRHERTDQNHCTRVTGSCQKCSWSRANRPPVHNNLLLFYSLYDGQVVIHILCVQADLLRVGFAFINAIALVLHRQNVSLYERINANPECLLSYDPLFSDIVPLKSPHRHHYHGSRL